MAVSAAAVRTRQRSRRFYVGMAIAIALTVFGLLVGAALFYRRRLEAPTSGS